jgi:O-antigen/teichoic acid export membrane protein
MLAKYGMIQLFGKIFPGMIGFLVAAVLTRLLAPEQYGVYGLASALAQLIALAGFGWLGLSVTRLATGRPIDGRFATSVFVLFGALAAATGLCGAGAAALPIAPQTEGIVIAAAIGAIVFALFDLRASFLTARFDFVSFLVFNLTRATAAAAVAMATAHFVTDGIAVFLVSCLAVLAVCLIFPRKSGAPGLIRPDRAVIAQVCVFGTPIAGGLTLFALSAWSDRLILGVGAGAAAVGFYTAAAVLVQSTLQMTAQAIGSAAYPLAVVAYDSGSRLVSNRQLEQNFIALLGILLPGGIALSMLAPNLSAVLVGADYRDAVIRLTPLLASSAVISGIRGNFVDHSFQLTGSTWCYLGVSADMAAVNLVALVLLVPRYGYMGAGAAGLLTAVVGFVHAMLVSRRVYRLPFPLQDSAKIVAAALTMALALALLGHLTGAAALCLQISVGLATYLVALCFLNLLNIREVARLMLMRWLASR